MIADCQWMEPADLPADLHALTDPDVPIPAGVEFIRTEPGTGARIVFSVIFGIPLLLGAAVMSRQLIPEIAAGTMLHDDWTFGLPFALILWLVVAGLVLWMRRGLRVTRRIREGRWRCGIFLLPDGVLLYPDPSECMFIPRAKIVTIRHERGRYWVTELHYLPERYGEQCRFDMPDVDYEAHYEEGEVGIYERMRGWFGGEEEAGHEAEDAAAGDGASTA